MNSNIDVDTVDGFGKEWSRFDQSAVDPSELNSEFERYFKVFPWNELPPEATGFDLGCGSGRWARFVSERVGNLHCVDASDAALQVAQKNLSDRQNVEFHRASVDSIPLPDESMDFGYSLGVLHHVPDTGEALKSCVEKLKIGAPFLVYLYYAFDDRPPWFRAAWRASDVFRKGISRLPFGAKKIVTDLIAATIYFPAAKTSALLEKTGMNVSGIPLSTYRKHSYYTMRTDSLDRFGTALEQRFTRIEITKMMERAGLTNIQFSDGEPYWCAVGYKA
ncbi:MAG: SAM-dependent methyltransferase [Acidobacteria bacterium]|nr:MAG: SAM-dependent methyltransferase [Acidobacteriota bacterium]